MLSDHEMRVLREIERGLAAQDPGWAERFGGSRRARTVLGLGPLLLLAVGGAGLVTAVFLTSAPGLLFAGIVLLAGGVWWSRRGRPAGE